MIKDKKHWYDGKFYDKLIAPNLYNMFNVISNLIEDGSNVIDIGCGTGWFCLNISKKCKEVTGVDLSSKNIKIAESKLKKQNLSNVNFIHCDANTISKTINKKFDYAVMTYMIHELEPDERITVLNNAKEIAEKIIIGDYLTPQPKNFMGLINLIVEFFAGKNHFKNYRSFQKEGGLKILAKKNNLKIIREIQNNPSTSHIVVLK